jgi:hypothetical protein
MTRNELTRTLRSRRSPSTPGFVDSVSGVRIEMLHPLEAPGRWRAYLDGAEASYRAHGVLRALDRAGLEAGRTTSLFFVAVDEDDRVVAGIRCHGPMGSAAEAYALGELDGHPSLSEVHDLLAERVAGGLVEIKGAWVDPEHSRGGLSDALARCHVHAMDFFGARYGLCSTSDQTAPRWRTTGGRPLRGLAPVPYPDARYETILLWWDRHRVRELSDPAQWARFAGEANDLAPGRSFRQVREPTRPSGDESEWRPEVLDERLPADRLRLAEIRSSTDVEILDRSVEQLRGLSKVQPYPAVELINEPGRWIYFSWRRCLVRLLGPAAFRTLRLDRNRNKITSEEQNNLERLRVGVVGLSVGHSIAYVLALEGICGKLRLADFDTIELSNLNRIPVSVLDLGLNKAVALGRRIAELDPYLELDVMPDGLTAANIDRFVEDLDVVIEECDSLDLKLLVRESARRFGIPVLMETSDRGLLDVERFDLEPDRPLFHGLLGDTRSSDLVGLSTRDKVPHVLRILEPGQLSSRMAASMAEIDESLSTWPQLGGDVSLGAATIAAAIRRLGRGENLPSGRLRVDLEVALDGLSEPDRPDVRVLAPATVVPPPADPPLAVAHSANLAPSGGNSQPWSLRLDGDRLLLSLDRTRTSTMDVCYRGSYVAIGAAVMNARIAAAAHGMGGPVEYFPRGESSDLVAVVNFADVADVALADLYPGVLARRTNRKAGRPAELGDAVIEALHRATAAEGARLHLLTPGLGLEDYAELLGESDRLRYLSPVLHTEMMSELRWPGRDPLDVGIDIRTLELDDTDLSKLAVAARSDVMAQLAAWDAGRALGEVTRDRVLSSSALAILTVQNASPEAYVRGGGALQRLWLASESAGLAVQPVSPLSIFAVDPGDFSALVPDPYVTRLRALAGRLRVLAGLSEGEAIVLVVRLSHAEVTPARSLRIPLQTVLLDPGAGTGPA